MLGCRCVACQRPRSQLPVHLHRHPLRHWAACTGGMFLCGAVVARCCGLIVVFVVFGPSHQVVPTRAAQVELSSELLTKLRVEVLAAEDKLRAGISSAVSRAVKAIEDDAAVKPLADLPLPPHHAAFGAAPVEGNGLTKDENVLALCALHRLSLTASNIAAAATSLAASLRVSCCCCCCWCPFFTQLWLSLEFLVDDAGVSIPSQHRHCVVQARRW